MSGYLADSAKPNITRRILVSGLTWAAATSQTPGMAHTYIVFDFGADEEKVQQARHKLEGWKQAFRLDKKLQFKFARNEGEGPTPAPPEKSDKQKTKSKAKSKTEASATADTAGKNGTVQLLVRLYFSPHEKLSEQRWIERIPAEEPFKEAAPRVIREGTDEFSAVLEQFDRLD
jgi:hypothetical protein